MIWSPHVLGDEMRLMLRGLRVHKEKQETRVEELSIEHTIGDGRLLLTLSILSHPINKVDNNQLEYNVDCDDNEGDRLPNNLGPDDVVKVLTADGFGENDISIVICLLIYFIFIIAIGLLRFAETLHCSREVSFFIMQLCKRILFILNDRIFFPEIISLTVVICNLYTINFWILFLFSSGCLRCSEYNRERNS
jgi:hypothetical protein